MSNSLCCVNPVCSDSRSINTNYEKLIKSTETLLKHFNVLLEAESEQGGVANDHKKQKKNSLLKLTETIYNLIGSIMLGSDKDRDNANKQLSGILEIIQKTKYNNNIMNVTEIVTIFENGQRLQTNFPEIKKVSCALKNKITKKTKNKLLKTTSDISKSFVLNNKNYSTFYQKILNQTNVKQTNFSHIDSLVTEFIGYMDVFNKIDTNNKKWKDQLQQASRSLIKSTFLISFLCLNENYCISWIVSLLKEFKHSIKGSKTLIDRIRKKVYTKINNKTLKLILVPSNNNINKSKLVTIIRRFSSMFELCQNTVYDNKFKVNFHKLYDELSDNLDTNIENIINNSKPLNNFDWISVDPFECKYYSGSYRRKSKSTRLAVQNVSLQDPFAILPILNLSNDIFKGFGSCLDNSIMAIFGIAHDNRFKDPTILKQIILGSDSQHFQVCQSCDAMQMKQLELSKAFIRLSCSSIFRHLDNENIRYFISKLHDSLRSDEQKIELQKTVLRQYKFDVKKCNTTSPS